MEISKDNTSIRCSAAEYFAHGVGKDFDVDNCDDIEKLSFPEAYGLEFNRDSVQVSEMWWKGYMKDIQSICKWKPLPIGRIKRLKETTASFRHGGVPHTVVFN
jgi:hypothetical protein